MHTRLACGSQPRSEEFNDTVLPHLADAHRLARWLVGNDHDAEDVVQEACCGRFATFERSRVTTAGDGS